MRKNLYLLLVFLVFSVSTFAQTVYKTKTGEKYHASGCRYLKSVIQTTVADAQAEGLTACSVCRPAAASKTSGTSTSTPAVSTSNSFSNVSSSSTSSTSVQCSGTTKAGSRCRRMTTDPSGRCYQH